MSLYLCVCVRACVRACVCLSGATCEVSERQQQVASVPWVALGGSGPLSLLQAYVKGTDPLEDTQRRDTSAPFSSPPFTQHRGTEGRTEGGGGGGGENRLEWRPERKACALSADMASEERKKGIFWIGRGRHVILKEAWAFRLSDLSTKRTKQKGTVATE